MKASELPFEVRDHLTSQLRDHLGRDQYDRLVDALGEDGVLDKALEGMSSKAAPKNEPKKPWPARFLDWLLGAIWGVISAMAIPLSLPIAAALVGDNWAVVLVLFGFGIYMCIAGREWEPLGAVVLVGVPLGAIVGGLLGHFWVGGTIYGACLGAVCGPWLVALVGGIMLAIFD